MLFLGLSLQILHCKGTKLTPTQVNQIQDNYKICTPGEDQKCEELQNDVDCSSCAGVGRCKCIFTCVVGGASSIGATPCSPASKKTVPKTGTLCEKICALQSNVANTVKKHDNTADELPFFGAPIREQLEFIDDTFPGGTPGFATFAALGAAVPPPLPMFPPIGLPQPVGVESNLISSIQTPNSLLGGGGAIPAAALTVSYLFT